MVTKGPTGGGSLSMDIFMAPLTKLSLGTPICVDDDHSLLEAVTMMQLKQFGCLLITKNSALIGILTERDILSKTGGGGKELAEIPVTAVMTPNPEMFRTTDTIVDVMRAMAKGGFRHLPVVDDQKVPTAVVSVKDIITYIVEHLPD